MTGRRSDQLNYAPEGPRIVAALKRMRPGMAPGLSKARVRRTEEANGGLRASTNLDGYRSHPSHALDALAASVVSAVLLKVAAGHERTTALS